MYELDQNKTPLFNAIKKYIDDNVIPFHVPGHKKGRGIPELKEYIGELALKMDVNGMEDLDYINNQCVKYNKKYNFNFRCPGYDFKYL